MKTINNINDVKFVNFEIGEEYQFNLEGMKVANATLKVTDKQKGWTTGKKSVIFGELTLTDAEGKATIYKQTSEIKDKGGWDISTLKNRLLGTTTTARGQRTATDSDKITSLINKLQETYIKICDHLNEDEQNILASRFDIAMLKYVANKANERLEKASTENKQAQKQLTEMITSGKLSTEQLLQIAQFMQAQTSEQ
jgi:hypothetical protein